MSGTTVEEVFLFELFNSVLMRHSTHYTLAGVQDVLALANCSRLTNLCLLGNTVAQKQEFR